VNFYFWNENQTLLRLNVDSEDRISSYCGNRGKASFPGADGYFYVRVVTTNPNSSLNLKVTAKPLRSLLPLPKVGCLLIEGETVPLYKILSRDGASTIVPCPQWEFISELIKTSINEYYAVPIPLTDFSSIETEHSYSVYTNSIQTMGPDVNPLRLATVFNSEDLYYRDGSFTQQVPEIVQDRGFSIQPVRELERGVHYVPTSVRSAVYTFTIPSVGQEVENTEVAIKCWFAKFSSRSPTNWYEYLISSETQIEVKEVTAMLPARGQPFTIDIQIQNCQEVKLTLEYSTGTSSTPTMFSSLLKYVT